MKAILIVAILLTMTQAETVTCHRDDRWTSTCEFEPDPYREAERREEREERAEYRQDMRSLAESAAFAAEQSAYRAELWALEHE